MDDKNIKDFELLAIAANYIKDDLKSSNNTWEDSSFKWVKKLSSGSKGKLGKLLFINGVH